MAGWPAGNPRHNPLSLISTFVIWRGWSVEVGSGRITSAGSWGRSAVHDRGRRPLRSSPTAASRFGALPLCGDQLGGQLTDGDKPASDVTSLGTGLTCAAHRCTRTARALHLHYCRTSGSFTPLVQRWPTAVRSCGADRNGEGGAASAFCDQR
jgi:hypothetical protein